MTDHTSLLAASIQRPPKVADSTTVTAGRETADPGNADSLVRSQDEALDRAPGRRPAEMFMTWLSALDVAVRAPVSEVDKYRILALPYPVEWQVFWRVLADMGVTRERLMDRMGARL